MAKLSFPSSVKGFDPENQGKTRDIFGGANEGGPCLNDGEMLIVATDRLSTHNIVHKSPIPGKGHVLTALTVFWLTKMFPKWGIPHHLVAYGSSIMSRLRGVPGDYPSDLPLRGIIVKRHKVLPIEFIFRGRNSGSFYHKFYKLGKPDPYGINMPPGFRLMEEIPVIFTPTEKSETDDELREELVIRDYLFAYELTKRAFLDGREYLRSLGIEAIDGKFEVGADEFLMPVVVDEVLTPDCCRFCEISDIKIGAEPPWLDKQVARDEAERVWGGGEKHPLEFSPEVVQQLTDTYLKITARIVGCSLQDFQRNELC